MLTPAQNWFSAVKVSTTVAQTADLKVLLFRCIFSSLSVYVYLLLFFILNIMSYVMSKCFAVSVLSHHHLNMSIYLMKKYFKMFKNIYININNYMKDQG